MQILNLKFAGSLKADDVRWEQLNFCTQKVAQNPAYFACVELENEAIKKELESLAFNTALKNRDGRGLYIVLRTMLKNNSLNFDFCLKDDFREALEIMENFKEENSFYTKDDVPSTSYYKAGDYRYQINLARNFVTSYFSKDFKNYELLFYKWLKKGLYLDKFLEYQSSSKKSTLEKNFKRSILRFEILKEIIKQNQITLRYEKELLKYFYSSFTAKELETLMRLNFRNVFEIFKMDKSYFKSAKGALKILLESDGGLNYIINEEPQYLKDILEHFSIEIKEKEPTQNKEKISLKDYQNAKAFLKSMKNPKINCLKRNGDPKYPNCLTAQNIIIKWRSQFKTA